MIDYHCHILPGLDDGAASIDESIAMARSLAEAGYERVCCTPHCIKGSYEPSPTRVREATLMLQADLDNAGIDLMLGPGMEYILDEYFTDFADQLMPLGNTRLVLCEAPPQATPDLVVECLQTILAQDLIPLVAHPERTRYFYESMVRGAGIGDRRQGKAESRSARREARTGKGFKSLFSLLTSRLSTAGEGFRVPDSEETGRDYTRVTIPPGCLYQANLGSFVGFYPTGTQERAYELLKLGAFHCLASDLHNARMGQKVLKPGIDKLDTNPLLKTLATRTPDDLHQLADQAVKEAAAAEQEKEAEQGKFDF